MKSAVELAAENAQLRRELAEAEEKRDELLEYRRGVEATWNYHRQAFIRDTASRIFAHAAHSGMTPAVPAIVWTWAQGLWDAKPENC